MAIDSTIHSHSMLRPQPLLAGRTRDARAFRLLYAAIFTIFLAVALVARLLPRTWDPIERRPGGRRSVVAEARYAASVAVGYAFMR